MKLRVNSIYLRSLIILMALLHLKCGNARTLASTTTTKVLATNDAMKNNSTDKQQQQQQQNATTLNSFKSQRINDTNAVTTTTLSTVKTQPESSTVVTHIKRQKRETDAEMPYDFNTMHAPCDLDQITLYIIQYYPNHCIWVNNNRFQHEGFYRVFKMYQTEGHFFGQYYERLKRFEIDPHFFEYS